MEEESKNNFYKDIEELRALYKKKLTKKSRAQLSPDERAIVIELKFFHDHVDLRSHMLVFAHCPESSSCINCKTFYQKNPQS